MITKKCNDSFGYGCTTSIEVENEEGLAAHFYKKNTHSGSFFLNTCKACVKKKHREKYAEGSYNWNKRHRSSSLCNDNHVMIGVDNGNNSGE